MDTPNITQCIDALAAALAGGDATVREVASRITQRIESLETARAALDGSGAPSRGTLLEVARESAVIATETGVVDLRPNHLRWPYLTDAGTVWAVWVCAQAIVDSAHDLAASLPYD